LVKNMQKLAALNYHFAPLHHSFYAVNILQDAHIFQRITVNDQQIGP